MGHSGGRDAIVGGDDVSGGTDACVGGDKVWGTAETRGVTGMD
jgi:hypothetical protein